MNQHPGGKPNYNHFPFKKEIYRSLVEVKPSRTMVRVRKNLSKVVGLSLAAFLVTGCEPFQELWGSDDCQNKMTDVRRDRGSPNDITEVASGGDYSETWYYNDGAVWFYWGDSFDNCEVGSATL